MNCMNETQQATVNAQSRHHQPALYRVHVQLTSRVRKFESVHKTYVRASSRHRAALIGLYNVRELYGAIHRKKGLKASTAEAFLETHGAA